MNEDVQTVGKIIYALKRKSDAQNVYSMAICVKNQTTATLIPETLHDTCMLYIVLTNEIYKKFKILPDEFQAVIMKTYNEMTNA